MTRDGATRAGNAAASQQGAAATEDLAPGVGRRASVRDQRRTAAAQIHRSLKAWRSEKGEEDAEASRAPAEGSKEGEGEEDAAPAPKKEETVNAKLLRLVHRSEKDKGAGPTHPNKPAIPDQEPNTMREQLALAAARSGQGAQIMGDMGDEQRLIAHYGPGKWVKFEYVHEAPAERPGVKMDKKPTKIVLHWFRSLGSGKNVEFKFKVREK